MDLKNLTIFGIFAGVAAFWTQFKSFAAKIGSFFIRTDSCEEFGIALSFSKKLIEECKLIRWGNENYRREWAYISKIKDWGPILHLSSASYILIYKKYIPIILSETNHGIKVTYFFKSFPFRKYLETVYLEHIDKQKQFQEDEKSEFYVSEQRGEDVSFRNSPNPETSLNSGGISLSSSEKTSKSGVLSQTLTALQEKNVIVGMTYADTNSPRNVPKKDFFWSDEAKKLLRMVKFWKDQESWFNERQLRHTSSCLATGKPGCGKSKTVLEIAKELRIPLFKINPSNMSDNEFVRAFESAPHLSIILIEDICTIFEGRTNLLAANCLTKQLLSFDTLINVLSGVKQKTSAFIIVTSNHPEKLHESLTRSGRLNAHIEFKKTTEEARRFIAGNILQEWPELLEKTVCDGVEDTASEFEVL
jgi:hypothetical protein